MTWRLRGVAHLDETCLIADRSGILILDAPDHDVENGNHKNNQCYGGHMAPADGLLGWRRTASM
jgi:hypothetical protein